MWRCAAFHFVCSSWGGGGGGRAQRSMFDFSFVLFCIGGVGAFGRRLHSLIAVVALKKKLLLNDMT